MFVIISRLLQNSLKLLKEQIPKLFQKIKGSKKDPLFYLGVGGLILFILVILGPCYFFSEKDFVFTEENLCSLLSQPKNGEKLFCQGVTKKVESPDFNLIQNNSLVGFSIPLVISPKILGSIIGDEWRGNPREVIEYEVQAGDTPASIAEKFDISLNTLLWANNLSQGSSIKKGQTLLILPVSGVLHHVRSGDRLSEIAKKYKGDINEIITFNELSDEDDIAIGDILIIPNGVMPAPAKIYTPFLTPLASSYFICPISAPCRKTQGLHWYNAVDLSHGQCGAPIYAAAQGQVLKTRFGWNSGAGNYVTILHPNGVVTMYGHLQSILVNPGQAVSQGQIIAYMGGQPGTPGAGKSTGCHLHFGVTGAKNPFR